jgi:site-specific DNA recombinase
MVPVRALVYSRVSTDAQERDGTSLDTQQRACVEYAESQGMLVVERIRDTASGYSLDLPGMEQIRQLLRQGVVDVVVCYAVDRLSRNQNHIGVLFDAAEQADVRLEFVTEKFEDTAIGRFILAARAFIGEVEREKIAERTMRGKAKRARSGRLPQGTGKGIYGYRYSHETGKREMDNTQATIVQRIFERFCDGEGCSKIASALNRDDVAAFAGGRWHPLTIRRMLLNETYTGRTTYRRTRAELTRNGPGSKRQRRVEPRPESEWIDVPGATPPIVSRALFAKAQTILHDPSRRLLGRPTRRYHLRGHLRCLICGTPMVGQTLAKGRYSYYRCRHSYAGNFEVTCKSKYVSVEPLERAVLVQIAQLLSDPQRIIEEARQLNERGFDTAQSEGVEQELNQTAEQQRRLVDLYVKNLVPENVLRTKGEELNQQRTRLEAKYRALEESRPNTIDLEALRLRLPEIAARLHRWVMEVAEDDMELVLAALQVQVFASREEIQIEGSVPVIVPQEEDLVTIVQTSACSPVGTYSGQARIALEV